MIMDIYLNPLELLSGYSIVCNGNLNLGGTSPCTHDLHHDRNILHSVDLVPPRTLRVSIFFNFTKFISNTNFPKN